ncbi:MULTISPECIES: hypothetical protein [Listeria]|uniref:hypothetical protein n=1 Tax=Listeria TaxID=1637 RepID=UPI000B587898|nr:MULTISPECIES: hypothetical protein [Listeria]
MRVFAGVLSIQGSILGLLSWFAKSDVPPESLFGMPENLAKVAGFILSVAMFIAGILIILAKENDFFLFVALILWVFGIIIGLLFSPSFSGVYFRPICCFICLLIGAYIFTDYTRKKH